MEGRVFMEGRGYTRDMAQVEEYMKVVNISYLEGRVCTVGYT